MMPKFVDINGLTCISARRKSECVEVNGLAYTSSPLAHFSQQWTGEPVHLTAIGQIFTRRCRCVHFALTKFKLGIAWFDKSYENQSIKECSTCLAEINGLIAL